MIDLEKIYASSVFSNHNKHPEVVAKYAMREAIRQALELAADNAKCSFDGDGNLRVNKQSILNCINKVK